MNIGYVLNSVFWSLVGGAGGYYVGTLRRDVNKIQERVDDVDTDTAAAAPTRRRHRRWSLHLENNQRAIGIVVVIMAVSSVLLVVYQKVQLDRTTACYQQYARDFSDALAARDKDTQQTRQDGITYTAATATMVAAIIAAVPTTPGQATPAQRESGFKALNTWSAANKTYLASLKTAAESAKRNPIPTNRCDG